MKQDPSAFKDEVGGNLMVSVLCILRRETHVTYEEISQFMKEFYNCITRIQNQYDTWPDWFVFKFL